MCAARRYPATLAFSPSFDARLSTVPIPRASRSGSATTSEATWYAVETTPEGLRHLNRLPDKVRHAALEAIFGPIAENPQRLGEALVSELEGIRSARRGDYRVIYEILQDNEVVLFHRVQRRCDR